VPRKPNLKPKTRTAKAARAVARTDTRLLGDVQLLLLKSAEDERLDALHPSEISKPGWCPRASFYGLSGRKPKPREASWAMELIWAEGHDIHHKWQGWAWDLGVLHGMFECMSCKQLWWDCSPAKCNRCGVDRQFLRYKEVPVLSEEHGIVGHADMQLDDDTIGEVKSIGDGTLRFEAPEMRERFRRKGQTDQGFDYNTVDWPALWRNLRRPFLAHRIQASVYAELLGVTWIVFIYESKWSQQPKEFIVKHDPELIAPILTQCKAVVRGLQGGRPPKCIKPDDCAQCARYESGDEVSPPQRQTNANGKRQSTSQAPSPRPGVTKPARRPAASAAQGNSRNGRRGSDGAVHAPNSLVGLSQRAFGSGRDR
jgi:hypothetical protein